MTRIEPPMAADERTMLDAYLEYYRESILSKVAGLTEEQARWRPAETANSCIAIVQHLAYVERWWFQECFADRTVVHAPGAEDDRDADLKVSDGVTLEQTGAFYRAEWEISNAIAADGSLDAIAAHPRGVEQGITLRWILVHMIEETARHAGHLDITRELIDGTTGD